VQPVTRARVAVSVTFLIHGLVVGNWLARIPAVKISLGLNALQLGVSLLGAAVGAVAAMPFTARLCGRYGSRIVTRVSSLLFCASLPLLAVVSWKWLLGPALVFYGAAAGSMDVSMNTQGADVERARSRPTMSSFHALFSIGGMLGAAIGGFAAEHAISVRLHLSVAAVALAIPALLCGPWLMKLRDEPRQTTFRLGPLHGILVGLSVISFCILLGEGAMADWSAIYLSETPGVSLGVAALGYAVFSAAMAAGRLAGDAVTARIGRVNVVRWGSLLAAAGLAAALIAGTELAAMIGFACVGAGFSSIFPNMCSAAAAQPNLRPEIGIATVSATGYLGFLVGPPLIGLLAEFAGLRIALLLVVMLSGLAAMLSRAARDVAPPQSPGYKERSGNDVSLRPR